MRVLDPNRNQIDTIADGTRTVPLGMMMCDVDDVEVDTPTAGEITFPIARANVESAVFSVTDQQLCVAMKYAFEKLKLVIGWCHCCHCPSVSTHCAYRAKWVPWAGCADV